jgi:hypothetical protein
LDSVGAFPETSKKCIFQDLQFFQGFGPQNHTWKPQNLMVSKHQKTHFSWFPNTRKSTFLAIHKNLRNYKKCVFLVSATLENCVFQCLAFL